MKIQYAYEKENGFATWWTFTLEEIEAAETYNTAASKYFGEYAFPNKIN